MKCIKEKVIKVVLYEAVLQEDEFYHSRVIQNLGEFRKSSNIIVSNRLPEEIRDVVNKVYTIYLFRES